MADMTPRAIEVLREASLVLAEEGRVSTFKPRLRHSRASMKPGSEMPGVPASEINAMVELFAGDDDDFSSTLVLLAQMPSYEEAADYLFHDLLWEPASMRSSTGSRSRCSLYLW